MSAIRSFLPFIISGVSDWIWVHRFLPLCLAQTPADSEEFTILCILYFVRRACISLANLLVIPCTPYSL